MDQINAEIQEQLDNGAYDESDNLEIDDALGTYTDSILSND